MHTWLSELDQFTQPRIYRISDLQDSNLWINRRTKKIDSDGERILQTSLKYDKLSNLARFTEVFS